MTGEVIHPLREWRQRQVPRMTLDAAAAAIGTVRQVWYDWETGRRLPQNRETYDRIFRLTKGAVSANELIFPFGLPAIGQLELPMEPPAPAPLFDVAEVVDDAERNCGCELQAAA